MVVGLDSRAAEVMAMAWGWRTLPTLADLSLLDLHPVFLGNFVQLFASELL